MEIKHSCLFWIQFFNNYNRIEGFVRMIFFLGNLALQNGTAYLFRPHNIFAATFCGVMLHPLWMTY